MRSLASFRLTTPTAILAASVGVPGTALSQALEVTITSSAGSFVITDNMLGDFNNAQHIIDTNFCDNVNGYLFRARIEEEVNGPRKSLIITETPFPPAAVVDGYFMNIGAAADVFMVEVTSSPFVAAVPAGVPWSVLYAGSGFDGLPANPLPCTCTAGTANGTVEVPTHFVSGALNGGAVNLGMANGPIFLGAPNPTPPFSDFSSGSTPAVANSLWLKWTLDPGPCDGIRVPSSAEVALGPPKIGEVYCSTATTPNSTGQPGEINAFGSAVAVSNDVALYCSALPANQFGYFLNSMTQAVIFPVPNSQGALCLGGAIGRYNQAVFNTGTTGTGSLQLDLANTPTPFGPVSIMPGETWNFTCWYRDSNPNATSNFTDGVSVTFQ